MRIDEVRPLVLNVSANTNWFFVKARLADGTEGCGEASLNGWEAPMLAYLERLAGEIVGVSLEGARLTLRARPSSPGGLIAHSIRSALEQALLDAEAKVRAVPIHALLGTRRRDRVRLYANINRATVDRTVEGCARSAQAAIAQGFTAVKIAPFDGVRRDQLSGSETRRGIEVGVERVMAIREAIGPKPDLMVDCHWRFDEPTALEVLARLAPAQLHWLECPVPERWSWQGSLARLRAAAREQGVLLAGAELQTGLDGFRPFFEPPLLDVIMPDVKYAGGIAETLRIVEAAYERGVLSSPHNPTGPVCTYASLHVAACARELPLLELQLGESPLYFDVVGGVRPRFENGCLFVPEAPGLGVELDEAVFRAHPYQPVPYGPEEHLG